MTSNFADPQIQIALATIRRLVPAELCQPCTGIVCGSGLSTLTENWRNTIQIPYDQLEGFASSTVQGHKSILAFGKTGGDGVPVVAMLGRFHPYEGHALATVVYPIRVLAALGVKNMIITNAVGSLNPDIPVGTIVVIQDHLAIPNLAGPLNPLLGPLSLPGRPRFLPLSDAYSPALRRLAFHAAHHLGLPDVATAEGTYAWVSGPTYETAAEGRFLRAAGADVVGMSTIPEVVASREEGMEVLVLSLVTNEVAIPEMIRSVKAEVEAELAGKPLDIMPVKVVSHEEVLIMGMAKAGVVKSLVERVVTLIGRSPSIT